MNLPKVVCKSSVLVLCAVWLSIGMAYADGKDPEWYARKATWEETMRVSREALVKFEAEAEAQAQAKKAADSVLKDFQVQDFRMTAGDKPQKIRVRVAGMKEIFILGGRIHGNIDGMIVQGHFIANDGKAVSWRSPDLPAKLFPERNRLEHMKSPVNIEGKDVKDGVIFDSNEVRVTLDGKYEWFEAWLAVAGGDKDHKQFFQFDWRGRHEQNEARRDRRNQVWSLIRRDFMTGVVSADQEIGDRDNIWDADWASGDFKNLAVRYANRCSGQMKTDAGKIAVKCGSADELDKVRALYKLSSRCQQVAQQCQAVNVEAAKLAAADMGKRFPGKYDAAKYLPAIDEFARKRENLQKSLADGNADAVEEATKLVAGVRAALLANPLLDGEKIIFVRRNIADGARSDMKQKLGFISLNSHCHVTINRDGWDDEIVLLSDLRGDARMKILYKPKRDVIVRDIDLDYTGDRMMFSSIDTNRQWAVYEMGLDGKEPRQVSPSKYPDIDWFNAKYLPDGRVILLSTASLQGLPCENGSKPMAQVYLLDPKTGNIRRLTYEQDSNYTPSVTSDGRILYVRWEYSDLPHYFTRILMTMNPDGTSQLSVYGSGSYYPTALLHTRAVPNDPNKVIGIVSGHHDNSEIGRLVLFDTSISRRYPFKVNPKDKVWGPEGSFLRISVKLPKEETGCVAEIPGRGEVVEGDVTDTMTANQWQRGKPFFTHPWPLDDNYFLVSAKMKPDGLWGLYLVDLFDNMTLIAEAEDAAFFEPIPFKAQTRPPVIPDRVRLNEKTATVHIADIYAGPGLKNIPRGNVKSLRVFAYHFGYIGTGGHASLGVESGWDIKRILGTVPVEPDGSVCFEIPANTPVSLQPLDEDGASLQLMRSWLVGMPGERVSCVGCHEDNRRSVPIGRSMADKIPMRTLVPWRGETRPFAFSMELYPVVQKYCAGCHTGKDAPVRKSDQGGIPGKESRLTMNDAHDAYQTIHPYVRRPGPESELQTLEPMEYHVSTSPLIQMLRKGHHGVKMDQDAWERLYAWIDLNAPFKGKWSPGDFMGQAQKARRQELAMLFANTTACPEDEYDKVEAGIKAMPVPEFVKPASEAVPSADNLTAPGFPMNADQAGAAQKAAGEVRKTVEIANGLKMELVRIPAGSFVMGSSDGAADERPRAVVKIEKPFWMGECEVSNALYHQFDAAHDTRYIDAHGKDHNNPGYIANHDNQPAGRVTWKRAMDFCEWMSKRTGLKVRLPTEAQWEWAARAGTAGQFFFGGLDDDFSKWANLADRGTRWNISGCSGSGVTPRQPYPPEMNFPLHDERFEDKWFVVDFVGQYPASPWGLKDIVGNVSEWTRSTYKAYPYRDDDGRNDCNPAEKKVARGGSWNSRPREAGSSIRFAYETYQPVHDVGFRVVIEE